MAPSRTKLLESADKLVRQGKLEEAIKQYTVLSDDNPRDVNTINRIGDLYVRLRKNKEAIRQFMRIADFYAGDGFHLKAIAMYKKITKLDPAHTEANERLADLYAKQGLVIEARTQFLGLAEQYLKAGQKPKAIQLFQKIQAMEPNNLKVRVILADLQGKEGDSGKAVDGFVSAADDLRKRGMNDEALKILLKAVRLQPGRHEIHTRIAETLKSGEKDPQETVSILEPLHEANPAVPEYLQMLAESYLCMDRTSDFEKLKQSAKRGEDRAALAQGEALFHHSRGDSDSALSRLMAASEEVLRDLGPAPGAALLEQALKIRPESPDVLEKLLDLWTTASDRDGMTSATERLARLLCQKEDWERAARFLDRLQDLAPENPAIAELRPRLDAHRGVGAPRPAEAAPATVPTLDELEKVVVLESDLGEDAGEDEVGGMEILSEAEAEPAAESAETPETGDEENQDAAYAGKSVIQEMRGQPVQEEIDEDFVNEHFTEAEVFLKYGLGEKAREQLRAILGRYPEHIPSLRKMKEIHSEDGEEPEAAAVCRKIAEIHRSRGEEEQALEVEGQVRELDSGAVSEETAEIPEISDGPASFDSGIAGTAAPLDLDLDLDLDLPDPSGEPEKKVPVAAAPVPGAPLSPAQVSALVTEEAEEDLVIELVDEEMEGEEAADPFDPDKASQFDFYLEQRLVEEAAEVLSVMERSAPGHPEVVKRRARLAEFGPTDAVESPEDHGGDVDMDVERAFGKRPVAEEEPAPSPEGASPAPDDGFFDLGAELKAQVLDGPGEAASDAAAGISGGEEASIDEIFKAFRRKVDQQVEEEDYETRYNLGIAYKEMGLLDEAIGEFQYASRDPKLFLECCSILGICFKEKGMTDLAIKWYRKALESTGHSEDKYQGLRYDLGDLYTEKGDYGQALAFFSEVYGINSNYRDVASRIRELRKRIG